MVSNCSYDFILASENCKTPFRYEVNYRNYFLVTEGEIKIKLAPPKSTRYLYVNKDYENFESDEVLKYQTIIQTRYNK
jgi:hypothetical protein